MPTTTTSILHRTVRLGAGVLIAGAALAACGDTEQVSSGPGAASAAAPEAAYVSPEQADRAAMLALRNAAESGVVDRSAKLDLTSALALEAITRREADAKIDRSAKLDLTSALAREAIKRPASTYVSPEQADRAAQLAVRNASASADALERRATVGQSSAHASADALERHAQAERSASAHRSADALEHWALSDSGS